MQKKTISLLAIPCLLLAGCQAATTTASAPTGLAPTATPAITAVTPDLGPVTFPKIDRHPAAADYKRGALTTLPVYDPASDKGWSMDLRSFDCSALDFRGSLNDLLLATFDDRTIWPAAEMMPNGFDRRQIMDLGRNPGLGIQTLHESGITGANVGIAIIDQPLLVDHIEYAERMRLYEEINIAPDTESQMRSSAVTSIAAGKTTGVAPGADLYYIATWTGERGTGGKNDFTINFGYYARAIQRIVQINKQLPEDRKIRVISIQVGWSAEQPGYTEITAAVEAAKAAGIFVISSNLKKTHGFKLNGLERLPMVDPGDPNAYEPGSGWADRFYGGKPPAETLLVPLASRTTASPTGADNYVFYREGEWSWSIPYIAGLYALAAQADPQITPEIFWSTALDTGRTIQILHEGKEFSLGIILDPVALIQTLQVA
jgi:hypothetical protein